ncbi:MAG: SusE domain-containing protein [Balneolales bacterium]|nr:SusE domain-containing protein [Balneolales bacterium]
MVRYNYRFLLIGIICCSFTALLWPEQIEARQFQTAGYNTNYSEPVLWNSSILYKGSDDALVYHSDEHFNRIPDFSHAGYRGGGVPLPVLPVKITLSPSSSGDDTQQIQQALDSVGEMDPDENGHRGAVLLNPGSYRITSTIQMNHNGVVLRGSGDGTDSSSNTVIYVSQNAGTQAIRVGRGTTNWHMASGSPLTEIVTEFVAVGNRHVEVENATGFEIGDEIVLLHPATDEWIEAVEYGGRPLIAPDPWIRYETTLNIMKLRTITGISGNILAMDVPVFNHLDRRLSSVVVYKPNLQDRIAESGVEHLRLILESDGPLADNHVNHGIIFNGVINSWAYGITVLHFRNQGIGTRSASFVTVQNARSLEPHSPIEGRMRYNFNVSVRSSNILFTDVHASEGRHCFVSNGAASASGIVFRNGTSTGAYAASEGHRRWSMGLLFEKLIFTQTNTNRILGLWNRGNYGTRHGWSAAHSVSWNVNAGVSNNIFIQRPPTAQNYGIANKGIVSGNGPWAGLPGFIEGTGENPEISSLYDAQLYDRFTFGIPPDTPSHLKLTEVQSRTYKLDWRHLDLDEISLVIERSKGDAPFQELTRISSSESFLVDETVDDEVYRYRIAAIKNGRMSGWSNVVASNMQFEVLTLQGPGFGSRVVLTEENSRTLNLSWSTPSPGYPVFYTWYFDLQDGDFSEPLLQRETSTNAVNITFGQFESALRDAGVQSGETLKGKWTVKATAGPLVAWAERPFELEIVRSGTLTTVEQTNSDLPLQLELRQNYPNPFNPATVISFGLPKAGDTQLIVYDMLGREVTRLIDGYMDAGWHDITWNGSGFASKTYLYRIQSGGFSQSRIMTFLK